MGEEKSTMISRAAGWESFRVVSMDAGTLSARQREGKPEEGPNRLKAELRAEIGLQKKVGPRGPGRELSPYGGGGIVTGSPSQLTGFLIQFVAPMFHRCKWPQGQATFFCFGIRRCYGGGGSRTLVLWQVTDGFYVHRSSFISCIPASKT